MSHELRTPLNAIIGFGEIMDAEMHGPIAIAEYREYVRYILASGRHLLRIIENVLEISNAEAGDLVLAKQEVDLAELVMGAMLQFEAACLGHRISVVSEFADAIVVRVDPVRMNRAIASLLSNAVKFTEPGGEIHISTEICDRDRVTIRIRDFGIGMEPTMIERAFAPFVQLSDKLSRPYEGAGLGLPLARLLAELHGGTVRIDSAPGKGTTATLELPAYSEPSAHQE